MDQPETSIIIRTYNESRYLPDLLKAIQKQGYRDYETIVVDSGSIDGTVEIAAQHADSVIPIQSDDFTFGYSLNIGIQAAKGRFIVIVSAHTLPVDQDWLAKLVHPLHDAQGRLHAAALAGTGDDAADVEGESGRAERSLLFSLQLSIANAGRSR